jgi:hypothetical protein
MGYPLQLTMAVSFGGVVVMVSPPFQHPDIPLINLMHDRWRVSLFDPRADGAALGARCIHGGYIAEVFRNDRRISAAPKPQWDAACGIGFPEVFEESLGFARAAEGEEYLRIGAGRVRKNGCHSHGKGPLTSTLNWTVHQTAPNLAVMETADGAVIDGKTFSYQLRRTVRLEPGQIVSESWLKVRCPGAHPLAWFAQPFFSQTSAEATAFRLPKGCHAAAAIKTGDDGLSRLPAAGGTAAVTGVWGWRDGIDVELDPSHGGGNIRVATSYPLDKLLLAATPHAASIQPYWSRHWQDGEDASWAVTYRWSDNR